MILKLALVITNIRKKDTIFAFEGILTVKDGLASQKSKAARIRPINSYMKVALG